MKRTIIFFVMSIFLLTSSCVFAIEIEEESLTIEEVKEVINMKGEPQILAKAALLYDKTYKKILYEKNIDAKVPNASTTKILTAIVAYENGNMNEEVIVSERAATVGGSTINLKKGNKILLGDLMKGLLICSGNDAAIAIAEHIGGSVEEFCNMMNQKAKELGASDTNFVTPHGLDSEGHYTTARNLMIFADYLLNFEYLANIVNTSNTNIKIDNYTKNIHTTNEMLSIYEEADGLKTGYTSKAGRCLVTSITKNGRKLISIVLGCDTKKQRTKETIQLINYGYNEFEEVNIYEKLIKTFNLRIEKSIYKNYEIKLNGIKMILLPKNKIEKVEYEYRINTNLVAPIRKNQKLGEIIIKMEGKQIETIEIKCPEEIKRKNIIEYMFEMLNNQKKYVEIKI